MATTNLRMLVLFVLSGVSILDCGAPEGAFPPQGAGGESSGSGLQAKRTDPLLVGEKGTTVGSRTQGPGSVEFAPVSGAETDQLLESTRALLNHRNRQLLQGGRTEVLAPPERVSASLRTRGIGEGEILRSRSARLAEQGEIYAGFRTDVRLIDAKRGRDRVVARIEETTSFDYARIHGDEPERTAFSVERLFTFAPRNGTWEIDEVKLANPGEFAPINEVGANPPEEAASGTRIRPAIPTSTSSTDRVDLSAPAP